MDIDHKKIIDEANCPIHKIPMEKIQEVKDRNHPEHISRVKFNCKKCNYLWNVSPFDELWSNDPKICKIFKNDTCTKKT